MNKKQMKKKLLRLLASYVYHNEALTENMRTTENYEQAEWTQKEWGRYEDVMAELSVEFYRRSQ